MSAKPGKAGRHGRRGGWSPRADRSTHAASAPPAAQLAQPAQPMPSAPTPPPVPPTPATVLPPTPWHLIPPTRPAGLNPVADPLAPLAGPTSPAVDRREQQAAPGHGQPAQSTLTMTPPAPGPDLWLNATVTPPVNAPAPVPPPPAPAAAVPPAPPAPATAPPAPPAPAAAAPPAPVPPAPAAAAPPAPAAAAPPAPAAPPQPVIDLRPSVPERSTPDEVPAGEVPAEVSVPAPWSQTDPIVPKRRGSRRAAREERRTQLRKRGAIGVAVVVVAALIGWIAVGTGGHSGSPAGSAPAGATAQTTLLFEVSGSLGSATASALLAHDSTTKAGAVVLIPSGVIAEVPGLGSMPFGQALSTGSLAAPRDALADLMGITVGGAWSLTPTAFAALIDKVGGVTVTVDRDVTKTDAGGGTVIVVPAGQRHLDGASAVAYATYLADGETEQQRLTRFDNVLRALLGQLPTDRTAVASLLSGLGAGSKASVDVTDVAALLINVAADSAANSTFDQVLPVKPLETGGSQNAFTLDTQGTSDLVHNQLADSVPPNRKAVGNRVLVENQVGTPGIGETTRTKLIDAGFVYMQGQNAPNMPDPTSPSVVLIFGTTSADIAKGDSVAKALGLPTSDVKVGQRVTVADVVVLVGADYRP